MRPKKGFTLIELAIAVGMLAIAILISIFSILNLQDLSELSKEKVIALTDANRVLEAMRDTVNNSLTNLRNTDWAAWATANVINTKGVNEPLLNQENVAVTVGNGNPVPVTLILTWNHRRRSFSFRVVTLMTDRT